jgi:hypothetical protein
MEKLFNISDLEKEKRNNLKHARYADSLSLMRAVQINITWTTTIKNPNKK